MCWHVWGLITIRLTGLQKLFTQPPLTGKADMFSAGPEGRMTLQSEPHENKYPNRTTVTLKFWKVSWYKVTFWNTGISHVYKKGLIPFIFIKTCFLLLWRTTRCHFLTVKYIFESHEYSKIDCHHYYRFVPESRITLSFIAHSIAVAWQLYRGRSSCAKCRLVHTEQSVD